MEIREALDDLLAGVTQLPQQLTLRWNRGIVQAFREAGATSPQTAQRFHVHSLVDESAFAALLAEGVIRQRSPGRYYLDEAALRRKVWFTAG